MSLEPWKAAGKGLDGCAWPASLPGPGRPRHTRTHPGRLIGSGSPAASVSQTPGNGPRRPWPLAGAGGGRVCGGGGSALPPAGLAASHPPRRFHGKVPQQPPGRGTLMGARCPGDSAPPRGGCAHVGSRRAGSVFRGSTIPSDYFIVPTNFRATQIRQKLPGQTGCDPTFPLLPESVGPVSLTRV